jgi:small-conductance mechanosensitive channel
MIIFFLVMLSFSSWYRINYKKVILAEKVEDSEFHLMLIRAPLLTALFLTSLIARFAYPDLPHTYKAGNLVLMMVPTIIFVVRMFHQHVRNWIGFLVAIFMLFVIYEFLFYPDILLRILLLAFSVTGILFFYWLLRNRPAAGVIKNQFVYRLLRGIIYLFIAMLAVALIANLVGAFNLAEFFTLAPIEIFLAALAVFVTTKVIGTLVYLFLISQLLHKLNFIREDFQIIFRKTTRIFNIILWLFFSTVALRILLIKEAVFDWGREALTTGWKIGAVDITPASILIFIFVIWIAVVITRLITRILDKDVFVRVTVAKGVPSTIIMLLKVVLITGGFFLAAAAAGMKLTNLSIVLGAFSVGIGFGLQNIFNNMVSGLILAFERPIKVGDVVQVGELVGIVLNIGLRSSVVKSYDGAEVIVPNGNLISDQMINWTRSDSKRRMDHRVGVAYGTDPEKVLAILESVAVENEKVDKYPKPLPLFIGFGDSSLDFRLLSWTDVDHRFTVESQINVAINRKLKEAGIAIPFPQRDLHIRSDATGSSSRNTVSEEGQPDKSNFSYPEDGSTPELQDDAGSPGDDGDSD